MNILVTGGASGLGLAITRKLAKEASHKVNFTYNKSEENAKQIQKEFPNTRGFKCDFKNQHDLDRLILEMQSMDLDVLVNNAITGMVKQRSHEINAREYIEGFQNNLMPVIVISQKAINIFRAKMFGKIINILTAALINKPPIGWSEYVASRAYLASLSKSWAVENAQFNITSNCISPALMLTKLTSDLDQRIVEEIANQQPLNKLLTVEEVSEAVEFFVTAPQKINGVNLIINSANDVI